MELRETSTQLRDGTLPIMFGALVLAVFAAPVVSSEPVLTGAFAVAAGLFALVVVRPIAAAYLMIGLSPLLVGIERGSILPLLRPNEALAMVVGSALLTRGFFTFAAGRPLRLHLPPVDLSLLALAISGSVLPLLWMVARGKSVEQDDLLYAVVLWKYYALFLIVRAGVRRTEDVSRCLWVAIASGSLIALAGILQALGLSGVDVLLARLYESGETYNRASSTFGQTQGLGDVMIFNPAIVGALLLRTRAPRTLLLPAGILFLFGTLASGQFSVVIALAVAAVAFGSVVDRLGRVLLAFLPTAVVGLFVLRPVVEGRLSGFDDEAGIPYSWSARLTNLQDYFWPEIVADFNWLLGVRTAARVIDPSAYYGVVWIESGHTWLLWTGGVPFFACFFIFLWVTMRTVARVARARRDSVGSAALAAFAALTVVAVGMVFDPHLTLRGTADLLFPLLALACAPIAIAELPAAALTAPPTAPAMAERAFKRARLREA